MRITQTSWQAIDLGAFLAAAPSQAIAGDESIADGRYCRSARVCGHSAVIEVTARDRSSVEVTAHLPGVTGLNDSVGRCRRLQQLDRLDVASAGWGAWSDFEGAIRDALAHSRGGGAMLAKFVQRYGTPVTGAEHFGITHQFPTPPISLRAAPSTSLRLGTTSSIASCAQPMTTRAVRQAEPTGFLRPPRLASRAASMGSHRVRRR